MKFPVTCAFLFVAVSLVAAGGRTHRSASTRANHRVTQKVGPPESPDLAQLRGRFVAAVGKDFEFVKDEFKRRADARGGGTYWLAHIKAKHSGYFLLNYRYNYNDPHYSHVERDFPLRVGARGCRRGPPYYGSYSRFCAGDTIVVPIAINNFTEHQFSLKTTNEDDATFENENPEAEDSGLAQAQVNNPVAEQMSYLGSGSHKLLHRNGGYTLEYYAVFQAQKPGRFNLALGVASQDMPAGAPPGVGASVNVPIIVVARDTPVTLLASRQEVRGYSRGYDGREWVSSTSGDSFMTDLMILQPGDRISLTYHSSVRSRAFERTERAGDDQPEAMRPLIIKLPFTLNTDYNFTEWLVDYLPK